MLVEAMAAGKTKHFGAPHLSIILSCACHDDQRRWHHFSEMCGLPDVLRSELLTSPAGRPIQWWCKPTYLVVGLRCSLNVLFAEAGDDKDTPFHGSTHRDATANDGAILSRTLSSCTKSNSAAWAMTQVEHNS